ncbi:MAG: single-stranded DNA-binding protein [Planctomycetaceae bacterium]|nr:single-stranded DNA-binding protein [Planctomycetaceae bacterium]
MASFNRVILMGNLTRDPEIRYTSGGTAVCDIGLAVNDRRKGADGQWVEETTFVDVTLWGRTAEVAGEYLAKGSPVLIEGRLKLDTWQTNDGQKRSKLHVVCERMQMVGPRGAGAPGGKAAQPRQQNDLYSQPEPADDYGPPPMGGGAPEDDIPF